MRMERGRPRHCDHRGHTDMAKRVWGAGLRKEKSQGSRARACVCVCVYVCVCVSIQVYITTMQWFLASPLWSLLL